MTYQLMNISSPDRISTFFTSSTTTLVPTICLMLCESRACRCTDAEATYMILSQVKGFSALSRCEVMLSGR
jgi:hypothetical protein